MMKNRKSFAGAAASQMRIIAFVVLCFIASVCRADHPPDCSPIPHGQACSLDSDAETVAVLDDMVLVGAANHLFSFGRDLSFRNSVPMDPQSDKHTRCTSLGLSNQESECRNFVKVIQEVPSGYETNSVDQRQIMVCGTNAFFPKCTIHEASMLSNYSYMTTEDDDEGYSPHSNKDPIVAVLTSNGRFFSATLFTAFQPHRTIGMSRGPLSGDSLFRVRAPISDPLWFHKPEFVSTYEVNDHIYFFIREPAYEVDNGNSVVYSRAIRICKSDEGQLANVDSTPFLTYQKARMRCSFSGERGSIPYSYDNLESTFLLDDGNNAFTLYGVFSSPDNGPLGSAICKFSFDPLVEGSLTKVFEDGSYTIRVTQNGQMVWITEEPGPFSCPGSSSGVQRTVEQSNRYQLIDRPVEAADPEPLYVVSGVKLDKIAADVVTYKGQTQEIVYFTTEEGEIRQAVYIPGSGTQEHTIRDVGSPVSYLSVHKNAADDTRQVYATTEDKIMAISRGDCAQYASCFECLDSKDAYCGWSPSANTCLNKLRQDPSDLTESHSASEETTVMLCGVRPPVSNPTPVVPTNPCPFPSKPGTSGVCTPETEGLNSNRNSSEAEMNVPTIVGATVGAFVLGVPVGAFVCFIFFRMFIRPRQSKNYDLEEENHVTRQTNANGVSRMSNVPNGDSVDLSTNHNHQKKDLSLSVDSVPHPSLHQPGPPRYVDVKPPPKSQLSSSVPVGSNGSAFTTSGIDMEMMYKHNSCVDISNGTLSKKDCSFGGSENDLVPPLVHLTGNEGYGTYKKPSKQTKFVMPPTGTNGISRTQVPGYKVPKGRTPSTTWLRENSISECSDLSSPLQSPISDV